MMTKPAATILDPTKSVQVGPIPPYVAISPEQFDPFVTLMEEAERHRFRLVHQIDFISDSEYHWTTTIDFLVPKRSESALDPRLRSVSARPSRLADPLLDESPAGQTAQEDDSRPIQVVAAPDSLRAVDENRPFFYAPLVRVSSAVLDQVDLRDESGKAIPVATREREYALFSQYLELLWQEALHTSPTDDDVEHIRKVVWYDHEANTKSAAYLQDKIEAAGSKDEQAARRFSIAIEELKSGGILCAVLQDARPNSRRMFRMSYRDSRITNPGIRQNPIRATMRHLGLAPEVVAFQAPDASLDHSVHYEIFSPPGLDFVRGTIFDAASEAWDPITPPLTDCLAGDNPAHLYSPPHINANALGPEVDPYIILELYPSPTGPHHRARSTSWWIAISVLVAAFFLPVVQAHGHSSELAAGFLAGAGGVSAFTIYSVDHKIAWRMLRPARWLLIWSALSVLLTSAMLMGVQPVDNVSSREPDQVSNTRDSESDRATYCSDDQSSLLDCMSAIARAEPTSGRAALGFLGPHRWKITGFALLPALILSYNRLYWLRVRRAQNEHSSLVGRAADLAGRSSRTTGRSFRRLGASLEKVGRKFQSSAEARRRKRSSQSRRPPKKWGRTR